MKRCIPDSFLLDVVRQTNGPDELRLSLDFTRPPDFRELTSSFRIITEGPMVSLRLPSLDVEEDENYRWIDDKGKQWRSYLIKTDKDEVNFLQILNATFFDVFQGQMLLTFRIEVEQEPPPPITAYFYRVMTSWLARLARPIRRSQRERNLISSNSRMPCLGGLISTLSKWLGQMSKNNEQYRETHLESAFSLAYSRPCWRVPYSKY
jgi:hypothetical protein